MVRSGSATHPSNCTRLWCSKYPQSTRKIFLGKLKCVAQAHTRWQAFARSSTRATAPVSGVPISTTPLLPFRYIWCSDNFPPAYQRRHKRKRPLTRDILRYQEEHCCAGLLRPFSPFPRISRFLLVSLVKSTGTFGWKPSHPTPIFALYHFDTFFKFTLF